MHRIKYPNELRRCREALGYSRKQVAHLLALKKTSPIADWERGYGLPSGKYLFLLICLYRMDLTQLYPAYYRQVIRELGAKLARDTQPAAPVPSPSSSFRLTKR